MWLDLPAREDHRANQELMGPSEHPELSDRQARQENPALLVRRENKDPPVFPVSRDFLVKLAKKVLLDLLDHRVNQGKWVHPAYLDSPVKEDFRDYRACLVLKAKVDPLAPLALQEIRVNKVKLVKKDRLDLKDVPDRRAPLAHLVPRVTRAILEFQDRLAEMVFQANAVCLVFLARWDRLVRTVIKENLANLVKRATKEAKEKLGHLVRQEILAFAVKLVPWVHLVKEGPPVTLDAVVEKVKTDPKVLVDHLDQWVTKDSPAQAAARARRVI